MARGRFNAKNGGLLVFVYGTRHSWIHCDHNSQGRKDGSGGRICTCAQVD